MAESTARFSKALYVCRNCTCEAAITDPSTVTARLSETARSTTKARLSDLSAVAGS